jgi:hypothetical protein
VNNNVRMARVWIRAAQESKFMAWRRQCLEYAANRRAKFYAEIRDARNPKIEPGQLYLFA